MLDTLRLVRGAVSTKDIVPVLTHFMIYDGRIQGANGKIAIDATLPQTKHFQAVLPAERFLKAVDACQGDPKMTFSDGKVIIKHKKFTARVSVLPLEDFPFSRLEEGDEMPFPDGFLGKLSALQGFIATDASRPWACSVMLSDGHMYATNNVVLARTKLDWWQATTILPAYAVDELLRIGVPPNQFRMSKTALFFIYDDFWMKAQRFSDDWPTSLPTLCEQISSDLTVVHPELLDAVSTLKPFFPDEKIPIVVFGATGVSTQDGAHSASVEVGHLPTGVYRLEPLVSVLEVATNADFARYPAAIPFYGPVVEGLLVGMRV